MSGNPKAPDLSPQFVEKPKTPEFLKLKEKKLEETIWKWTIIPMSISFSIISLRNLVALIEKMIGECEILRIIGFCVATIGMIIFIISLIKDWREGKFVLSGLPPFFDQDQRDYIKSFGKMEKSSRNLEEIILIVIFKSYSNANVLFGVMHLLSIIRTMIERNEHFDDICFCVAIIGFILLIINIMKGWREVKLVKSGKHPFLEQDESEYLEHIMKLEKRNIILIRISVVMGLIMIVGVSAFLITRFPLRHFSNIPPAANSSSITIGPMS